MKRDKSGRFVKSKSKGGGKSNKTKLALKKKELKKIWEQIRTGKMSLMSSDPRRDGLAQMNRLKKEIKKLGGTMRDPYSAFT